MAKLPEYIGPVAFGIKMGVVLPGTDLVDEVVMAVKKVAADDLLGERDVICITESVVARSQNNYVTLEEVAAEIQRKLQIGSTAKIGVVFPIASRNRFSQIMQGIAKAVPQGEVIVQMPFPCDEVGNQIILPEVLETMDIVDGIIEYKTCDPLHCLHPITKVNYLAMYQDIIEREGAKAIIILSNDPLAILAYAPAGVIAADIHSRQQTRTKLQAAGANVITLQDLCNTGENYSEWGLLGSNMSANSRLKLAPRNAEAFSKTVQSEIAKAIGYNVEVLVYGDGAYKDPSTGIYELADPMPVFGMTDGFFGRFREGIKYKYVADVCHAEGKSIAEIEVHLAEQCQETYQHSHIMTEGTTPRRIEDVIASLADLVSGSADAGTPVVIVKNIL